MRLLAALFAITAPLLAQTTTGSAVTWPAVPITVTAATNITGFPTVWVCLASGVCGNAGLDSSLAVNTSGVGWVISAKPLTVALAPSTVVLPIWHPTEIFTSDGKTLAFLLGAAPIADSEFVAVAGVLLVKSQDYTVAGQVVTLTVAPASKAVVSVRYQVLQAQNLF